MKKIFIIILLVVGFFLAYFIKCQLGICLIKNFFLDKYPPFSWLQNRNPHGIVNDPPVNVNLLSDGLSFIPGVKIWADPWMQEEGMVTRQPGDHEHGVTQSWVITNQGPKNWAMSHEKSFKVQPGDIYAFSGGVKTSGQATGSMAVVLYDGNMKVEQWDYATQTVTAAPTWQKVEKEFEVPEGAQYIRFELMGKGQGSTWFDGIVFKKVGKILGTVR